MSQNSVCTPLAAQHNKQRRLPDLNDFERLPASARVPLPVVCGLFSISPATAWRRVKSGAMPQPVRDGACTRWIVGDLRRALARAGA